MSFKSKAYILSRGNHSRIEEGANTLYVPGSAIVINTQREYDKLAGRLLDTAEVEEKVANIDEGKKPSVVPDEDKKETPVDWSKVSDMHWASAVSGVKLVSDLDTLSSILIEEQKGRSRKAVIDAVQAQMVAKS